MGLQNGRERMRQRDLERQAVAAAKKRLDRLDLYPSPVRTRGVRILSVPWVFGLPGMRRFYGYEFGPLILIRMPLAEASDDLITHELCHVWQWQQRPLRMPLTMLTTRYERNPYELEARRAVAETRADLPQK
jgi:hypothetical protein